MSPYFLAVDKGLNKILDHKKIITENYLHVLLFERERVISLLNT